MKSIAKAIEPVSSAPNVTEVPSGIEALRIAGHDFKTPLTTLKTLAQLFQHSLEKGTLLSQPERTARNCRMLNEQVDRLVELSDQLLDVARAFGGRLKFSPTRSDLRQVISAAAQANGSVVEDVSLPEEEVYMDIDPARLEQAFGILISEGARLRITLEVKDRLATIKIDGEFRPLTSRNVPSYFIAMSILQMHGAKASGRFEIGPFTVADLKR